MCVWRQAAQKRSLKTSTSLGPLSFNKMVCFDLKYVWDSVENRHIALSGICAGTMHHVACLVKNRVPRHVVQCSVEVKRHVPRNLSSVDVELAAVL